MEGAQIYNTIGCDNENANDENAVDDKDLNKLKMQIVHMKS